MSEESGSRRRSDASLAIGILLILVGALWVVGRAFGFSAADIFWPFFVIVPGAVLFVLGLTVQGPGAEPLVVIGSIVTTVGTILFYQNATGHWASWAYAWALVAPTSVGVGLAILGAMRGRQDLVKSGTDAATVGIIIFVVGAVFFELILGISGFGLGGIAWPVLLIGAGVLLLVRNLLMGRKSE